MELYEWLTILAIPTILTLIFQTIYAFMFNKVRKSKEADEAIKKSIQSLLRMNLKEQYKKLTQKGFADDEEKDDFNFMYNQYHSLGKNGVMDAKHKEVISLPITKTIKKNVLKTKEKEKN